MNPVLNQLILRYPILRPCQDDIEQTFNLLKTTFENGGSLYVCGNGGSASDALHIVGELMKSFTCKRSLSKDFLNSYDASNRKGIDLTKLEGALPAYALVENSSFSTAYGNDVDWDYSFAQQVYGYVENHDIVLGISTSGNSKNIINALNVANLKGAKTIGLTGRDGGALVGICDSLIIVPEVETYKIQELHLPIYHCLCVMLEQYFWPIQ